MHILGSKNNGIRDKYLKYTALILFNKNNKKRKSSRISSCFFLDIKILRKSNFLDEANFKNSEHKVYKVL